MEFTSNGVTSLPNIYTMQGVRVNSGKKIRNQMRKKTIERSAERLSS